MNDGLDLNIDDEIIPKKRNPFYGLIALFVAVALFLLSLQGYFYLIHPEPTYIASLEEIRSFLPADLKEPFSTHRSDEVTLVIFEFRDTTKQIANYIASKACKKADSVCQSKALFYFVRDNIQYVPDERFHDTLANPLATLKTGGADCEDMAVLVLALEMAIGNEARLVFIPGHAYAQISITDYKDGKWLNLEPTCKTCDFNELPNNSALQRKNYYEL
jgi:transglutaminase-like putative cysteine protease